MLTIAILNAKGGSGKTTISTHLASYYAETKYSTALVDYDSQGSSTFWANSRLESQAPIHCIPAYQLNTGHTLSFKMRTPIGTERIIIDTPAAITRYQLDDIVKRSNLIIIPVLPSSIDFHAVSGFIEQLQKLTPIRTGKTKIAVVANRVTTNSNTFSSLEAHLKSVNIPFIAKIYDTLSDIQTLNEKNSTDNQDTFHILQNKNDWHPLINWIEGRECFTTQKTTNITHEGDINSVKNATNNATIVTPSLQQPPSYSEPIKANITQLGTLQSSTSTFKKNMPEPTQNIESSKLRVTKLSFTNINTNKIISSKIDATDLKNKKTDNIAGNKSEDMIQAI